MTPRPRLGLAAIGGLLFLALPAAAMADPPRTPALDAASDRFEAGKRLFREGKREHNQTKIERAYFEFKAAYAIYPGRGTLLNLTEAELATDRPLDAMRHVRDYVREYGVPEETSEYHRTFDADENAAFRATGHIMVVGPPSMRIVVDGHDEGLVTPIPDAVDVGAGHHIVELLGSETLRGEVEAPAGTTTKLEFSVANPPAPTAATPGAVTSAMAMPGVAPPVTPIPMDSRSASATSAFPPAPDRPRATSGSYWSSMHIAGAVLASAGVIAIGTGVGFAVLANQDSDRASSLSSSLGPSGCAGVQSQACRDLQTAHDDQSRDHALNLVLLSVGAVAAVAGGALLLLPSQARPASVAFVPTLSAESAGFQVQGVFR